jgi:hypothetical protein
MVELSTGLVIEQDIMRKGNEEVQCEAEVWKTAQSCRPMWLNTVTDCSIISATLVELFSTKRSAEEHIEMTHTWMKRDVGTAL